MFKVNSACLLRHEDQQSRGDRNITGAFPEDDNLFIQQRVEYLLDESNETRFVPPEHTSVTSSFVPQPQDLSEHQVIPPCDNDSRLRDFRASSHSIVIPCTAPCP